MMLGKLPLEKLGPEEKVKRAGQSVAKNWKAREGGSGKDRGRAPYLDSVSLFLFEPL